MCGRHRAAREKLAALTVIREWLEGDEQDCIVG
jgi:hypothetical protein